MQAIKYTFSQKTAGILLAIATILIIGVAFAIPVSATNDCSIDLLGICQNTNTPCTNGLYRAGYCPGAADIQCCVPNSTTINSTPPNVGLGKAIEVFNTVSTKAGFPPSNKSPEAVIGLYIRSAMLFIGVIFAILIIYGGYLWMVARGNDEYVKKATGILKTAIIGFIITIAAYAISTYIVGQVLTAAFGV